MEFGDAPATEIPARTGKSLSANVEIESHDGSIVIMTRHEHGHRSAHRDHAQRHFKGHVLWRMNSLSWLNSNGVRVAMTRWNTQEFRKGSLPERLTMKQPKG